jgi:hypothetical protein
VKQPLLERLEDTLDLVEMVNHFGEDKWHNYSHYFILCLTCLMELVMREHYCIVLLGEISGSRKTNHFLL